METKDVLAFKVTVVCETKEGPGRHGIREAGGDRVFALEGRALELARAAVLQGASSKDDTAAVADTRIANFVLRGTKAEEAHDLEDAIRRRLSILVVEGLALHKAAASAFAAGPKREVVKEKPEPERVDPGVYIGPDTTAAP